MKSLKLILAFILFIVVSCDEYEIVPDVASFSNSAVTTVSIDRFSLEAVGSLSSLGDGIVEHGFVWSGELNVLPTVALTTKVENGQKTEPGEYTNQLNVDLFEFGVDYVLRAFAIDKHGREGYGDEMIFRRIETFEIVVEGIPTPPLGHGLHMPVLALSDGSYAIGVTLFGQAGVDGNYLLKYQQNGTKDPGFSSAIDQTSENPIQLLEINPAIVTLKADEDACDVAPAERFNLNDGTTLGAYILSDSEVYNFVQVIKMIPTSAIHMSVICHGVIPGTTNDYAIFKKNIAINSDAISCAEPVVPLGTNEVATDAIMMSNEEILIAGIDRANQDQFMLAVNDQRYLSGIQDYAAVRIGETPDGPDAFLSVGKSSSGKLAVVSVSGDFTQFQQIAIASGADFYPTDVIVMSDGSFVVVGSGGDGAIAKYSFDGSSYVQEWLGQSFSGSLLSIDLAVDGGFVASATDGLNAYLIKTDRQGNID